VPDVDHLQSIYHESSYVADLPDGQCALIPFTGGTKQGDKLSSESLRFDLSFNCLLLALRATGIVHSLMMGSRTPARGFASADDLVLCTESPEKMRSPRRSGWRLPVVVKLQKPVVSFASGQACGSSR
jgi:hypothetical protein